MSTEEISTWLEQGLDAAKSGDRIFARQQLQRVIEADDHNLQAWQALSEIAATLEDREVCLENVLALDPNNEAAHQRLNEVQAQLASISEEEAEAALAPLTIPAAMPQPIGIDFSGDQLDDPLLCVYCGHLTREEDRVCPHCRRSLVQSFYERERPRWIVLGWGLNIFDALYNLTVLGALLFFLSVALSASHAGDHIDIGQVLLLYIGQPTTLSPQAQAAVFNALPRDFFYFRVGYVILIMLVAFGLLTRRRVFHLAFIASLAVATALALLTYQFNNTILTSGEAAPATPFERILQVVIFEASNVFTTLVGALAVLLLLLRLGLIFLMENDFARITERLWNLADRSAKNARTAFIRAKEYMKRDMWTLAATCLQQAIALDSTAPDYFVALAESYAHVERYPRALAMLDQADRLQADLPATARLRGVILDLHHRAVKASTAQGMPGSPVEGNGKA